MRIQFLIALIIVAVVGTGVWYTNTSNMCPAPLHYRVGDIDPSFDIDEATAREHIETAANVWNSEYDASLFVYDENAQFVVDFVFDDRQARADSEANQSSTLDSKREENEVLFETIEDLQEEYDDLSATYQSAVASYEARLEEYNATVRRYNDQGGAPPEAYAKLQEEEAELSSESQALSQRAKELNNLASELNELSDRANSMVEAYNREVERYNDEFGHVEEFTQGDYDGDRINIYKFSDSAELITVLTHEFGHALGINHVEEEGSVMYYLLTDSSTTPTLATADKEELLAVCGSLNGFGHQLRGLIRTIIQ